MKGIPKAMKYVLAVLLLIMAGEAAFVIINGTQKGTVEQSAALPAQSEALPAQSTAEPGQNSQE